MTRAKGKRRGRGRRGLRTARMERIGAERIDLLVHEAKRRAREGEEALASKYIIRAKKIAMRLNLKTLGKYRGEFCKECMVPFVSASIFRARLHGKKKVITCLRCGNVHRRPIEIKNLDREK
ncbi:MAG: hypothetical protein QGH39_04000 [Candidatus Thermoplasmatota archaeon]|nr:hypothetical protein [Candidatus Thermoplasmatota archaeon]